MKKILAFSASPRKNSNSGIMLNSFCNGAKGKAEIEIIDVNEINLISCRGCLRCNILKKCALKGDDWQFISDKILEANVLVFALPVYFHHVPAPLKALIDRFRSFIHVHITETGLKHTPFLKWEKDFVLLMSLGSSVVDDAMPIINLFEFITKTLGDNNSLSTKIATRLAVSGQILFDSEKLKSLYEKMKMDVSMAESDFETNKNLLSEIKKLACEVSEGY